MKYALTIPLDHTTTNSVGQTHDQFVVVGNFTTEPAAEAARQVYAENVTVIHTTDGSPSVTDLLQVTPYEGAAKFGDVLQLQGVTFAK